MDSTVRAGAAWRPAAGILVLVGALIGGCSGGARSVSATSDRLATLTPMDVVLVSIGFDAPDTAIPGCTSPALPGTNDAFLGCVAEIAIADALMGLLPSDRLSVVGGRFRGKRLTPPDSSRSRIFPDEHSQIAPARPLYALTDDALVLLGPASSRRRAVVLVGDGRLLAALSKGEWTTDVGRALGSLRRSRVQLLLYSGRSPDEDLRARIEQAGGVVVRGDRGMTVVDLYRALRSGQGTLHKNRKAAKPSADEAP